jgi:hypothetical protein
MKKIAAMCLGLSMLVGTATVFADATDTTKTKKAKKTGTTKKTKAKKTTEEKK